jgi:hypothetical protein
MGNFDYKKYSLENIEKWVRDALTSGDASSREIYDTIKKVAEEEYYYFKHYTGKCYDLLALLNGNRGFETDTSLDDINATPRACNKDDKSPECQKAWNDFWEENYYPEEHSKYSEEHSKYYYEYDRNDLNRKNPFTSQYTEEEMNAMCDKAASDQEKEQCQEYNLREAEYYDKRPQLNLSYDEMIAAGYTMTDDGFWIPPQKGDKVVKWQLPVEVDGLTGDCLVQFPDDLLEAANLKEGDVVEWIGRKDGSFELRKVNGTK